jgi:class 3 adenylate cyclase
VVTVLNTDVVGSPEWTDVLGEVAGAYLARFHREIGEEILKDFASAWILDNRGGDPRGGLRIVFMRPSDAVRFALRLQARFRLASAGAALPLHVRVGIHMGEAHILRAAGGRKVRWAEGPAVDAASRVLAATQGGQILMTGGVFRNALTVLRGQTFPALRPIAWVNHGAYRLHGPEEVVELCEAGEHGPAPLAPPPGNGAVSRMEAIARGPGRGRGDR